MATFATQTGRTGSLIVRGLKHQERRRVNPGRSQSVVVSEADGPADGYRLTVSSVETTSVAVTSLARLTAEITAAPSAAATIHHRSRSNVTVVGLMMSRTRANRIPLLKTKKFRRGAVREADTLSRA
jgi:hypothetical protein